MYTYFLKVIKLIQSVLHFIRHSVYVGLHSDCNRKDNVMRNYIIYITEYILIYWYIPIYTVGWEGVSKYIDNRRLSSIQPAAASQGRNRQMLPFSFLGGPEVPLQKTSQLQICCVQWHYSKMCMHIFGKSYLICFEKKATVKITSFGAVKNTRGV